MNRVVASAYAVTIGGDGGPLSEKQKIALLDLVPVMISEINRLHAIASDPFVRGYMEAKEQWKTP